MFVLLKNKFSKFDGKQYQMKKKYSEKSCFLKKKKCPDNKKPIVATTSIKLNGWSLI